jgi:tetratricopeptide (TPR) repeat protein
MEALTDWVRGSAGLALVLTGAIVASAQPVPADPLARARQLYNAGQYDEAITAALEAAARVSSQSEVNLLLGRALLERHRASRTTEDLAGARAALGAVDASGLSDRGRLDLVVGMGEALYLDGQYRSAASLLEPALEQMSLLSPTAREQVVDWWGTAMDRYAQTRPPDERAVVYDEISSRLRLHLARHPDSSASSYWLPAAALARGELELAWDLALAGWVRSTLSPDKGVQLRTDLDRMVTQALIPERVKRLVDEPDAEAAAARFASEWDEAKGRWH